MSKTIKPEQRVMLRLPIATECNTLPFGLRIRNNERFTVADYKPGASGGQYKLKGLESERGVSYVVMRDWLQPVIDRESLE